MSRIIKRKITIYLLVALFGSLVSSGVVFANFSLDSEDLQIYSANNILFYEPCAGGSSSTPGGSCISEVSGSTIEEKIWSGLTAFLTEEQAAGVMGNMSHEGGFNPARHETTFINSKPDFPIATNTSTSYGIGLVQWSFGRRVGLYNFLKENGAESLWTKYIDQGRETYGRLQGSDFLKKADEADVNALVAQELCYLKSEIDSNDGYGEIYKAKTVAEAANTFLRKFEKPAGVDAQQPIREKSAQKYYDQFHGKTISGGGGSSSSTPSCNSCEEGSLNLNGVAACMAHPLGSTEKDYKKSDGGKATPLEAEAAKKFDNADYIDAPWCSGFTALLVRWSGYDKKFTANMERGANKTTQADKANKKLWEIIDWDGDTSELRGGDIINCTAFDHSWIVIEDENGDFYQAEASVGAGEFGHIEKLKPSCGRGKIIRAKNAKNSNAGVSVTGDTKSSSKTGTTTASGKGNGDIGASAIELAYPEGTSKSIFWKKPFDAFLKYFSTLGQSKTDAGMCHANGKSCDRFAATVIRYSGVDENMNFGPVPSMLDYVRGNSDWEKVEMKNPKKLDEYKSGDLVFFYKNGDPVHVGIYAEGPDGKGHVVQASYCEYYGIVKDTSNITSSSYFNGTREVYRNKNNKTSANSSCDVCGGVGEDEDGGSAGGLKEGGMTLAEAKKWIEPYRKAAMGKYYKKTGDIMFDGAKIHDADCPYGVMNNCVALSQWFVNKYTTIGPTWNSTTNGVGLAKKLGGISNVDTGNSPRPYAIFSNGEWSAAGHTGVILGVDKSKKKVVIAEATCSESGPLGYEPRVKEETFERIKNWNYAYMDKVLKTDGGL